MRIVGGVSTDRKYAVTQTKLFATLLGTISLSLLMIASACSKKEQDANDKAAPAAKAAPANKAAPAASPAEEAKEVFKTRCAVCHGATGKGDGAAAANLNPKPANYSDAAWQKSVTDQQIEDVILKGGAAVGKSQLMPANPDLGEKPAVVTELRKLVRGFGP